jgi:protein-S-isoprenylcysteine O-methyltransferase Ste14
MVAAIDDSVRKDALRRLGPFWGNYRRLLDYVSTSFGPGPKCVKMCVPINLQKGGTALLVLALMKYFENYGTTAHVYLALHGSYGLIWLLKELICPDPGWQEHVTVGSALISWIAVLGPYWLAPYLLISSGYEASNATIAAAIATYAIGVVTMIGSDAQKYFVLKERKGLIMNGFFSRVRHPNYLGEMMIYGSFAALSGHWQPWGVLAWVWLGLFTPNMLQKEARMARHGAIWEAYKKRSGFLIPKIF